MAKALSAGFQIQHSTSRSHGRMLESPVQWRCSNEQWIMLPTACPRRHQKKKEEEKKKISAHDKKEKQSRIAIDWVQTYGTFLRADQRKYLEHNCQSAFTPRSEKRDGLTTWGRAGEPWLRNTQTVTTFFGHGFVFITRQIKWLSSRQQNYSWVCFVFFFVCLLCIVTFFLLQRSLTLATNELLHRSYQIYLYRKSTTSYGKAAMLYEHFLKDWI